MNSNQITKTLHSIEIFKGVYARDTLPLHFKKPAAFIVNTDSKKERGEHWIAILVTNTNLEYFDPLGFPPFDKNFLQFIKRNSKKYFYNCKTLQNPESTLCGTYCIAFIRHRANRKSFRAFIRKFTKDTIKNDKLVKELLK